MRAFGVGVEQGADQCQFGLHAGVGAVELQRLAVGLAGEPGIDVAEVFVGGCVARVGADRHFQRGPGLVKLALAGVEHRQVVIGLGQFRIVFGDFAEGGNRVAGLAGFGLDHALEEAHLRIARLAGQVLFGFGHGLGELVGFHQATDVGVVVGMRRGHRQRSRQQQQAQGGEQGFAW